MVQASDTPCRTATVASPSQTSTLLQAPPLSGIDTRQVVRHGVKISSATLNLPNRSLFPPEYPGEPVAWLE